MNITIFGATGTIGRALVTKALAENYTVTVLVRSPEKLGALGDNVKVLVGDYFDADMRTQALEGSVAVLSTIGPPMKRAPNNGEYAKAMTDLIDQMQSAGIRRFVAVGGAGLRLGTEKLALPRRIMRFMLRSLGGKGYWDKEQEHNALFLSSLDWTILRPPQVSEISGKFIVSEKSPAAFKADPNQIAHYMVKCLSDADTIRTAPFVATK